MGPDEYTTEEIAEMIRKFEASTTGYKGSKVGKIGDQYRTMSNGTDGE